MPVLSTVWPRLLAGCLRGGRLRLGAPSCIRTHKQVPTEGKWRVPAKVGAPSQQQHLPSAPTGHIPPPLALVAPQTDRSRVGDASGAEVCGHGWRGSCRQTPTRCSRHHPGAILLQGHGRGTLLAWGLPQHGLLQPLGQATARGEAGRGPGAEAFPAASSDPTGAQPVGGAMLGLGFLSVFTHCINSLSE